MRNLNQTVAALDGPPRHGWVIHRSWIGRVDFVLSSTFPRLWANRYLLISTVSLNIDSQPKRFNDSVSTCSSGGALMRAR